MSCMFLRKSVFLHIPKTGGKSVNQYLEESGLVVVKTEKDPRYLHTHMPLLSVPQPYTTCPKFSFIRHPLEWWRSWWAWGQDKRQLHKMEFVPYVFGCIRGKITGHHAVRSCTEMFESFIGTHDRRIEFIGRMENLSDDLPKALMTVGEKVTDGLVVPKIHETKGETKARAIYTKKLFNAVMDVEGRIIEEFYNDTPINVPIE